MSEFAPIPVELLGLLVGLVLVIPALREWLL